jgi:hypothetical protein
MPRVRILRPFVDLRRGDKLFVTDELAAKWVEAGRAEVDVPRAKHKAVLGPKEN